MRTGTIVSLGASAVLGLGALIVARVWLPQSNHAQQGKPAVAMNTVPVVVASSAIPYGGKLDAAHLTVVQLPANAAPQGAYATPAQILQQQGGPPIALTPIAAHEPLLPGKLSGGGARPTVSAVIDEGMRGYTIPVSDVTGAGGHVLVNDRVDVILSRDIPIIQIPGQPSCNCKRVRSDVLLQNVKVLGVDLNADPTTTQAAVAHTATLEVDMQSAQKLAVATQVGTMSLALRRTGEAEPTPARTVEISDLHWTGARAPGPALTPEETSAIQLIKTRLRPAPHTVSVSPQPQILINTHSVTVVHGDTQTQVQVPAERYGPSF
jgi:pilus assembly protein CpaB